MTVAYRAPGVYREEIFLQPEVALPTGIPGFVGFFHARDRGNEVPTNVPILLHRDAEFSDLFTASVDPKGLREGYLQAAIAGFLQMGVVVVM